jgi:hypothetical protein
MYASSAGLSFVNNFGSVAGTTDPVRHILLGRRRRVADCATIAMWS